MSVINATWAQLPIQLTEGLGDPVWTNPGTMRIPGGILLVKNDAHFLYAALDMISDTGNDAGTGDYCSFTFDRNRDGNITPNFDVKYALYPGLPNKIGKQYYLAPETWTGLSLDSSLCRSGFETSPYSATPHRVWKLRFSLTELNVSLIPFIGLPFTRFGIQLHSTNPPLDNYTPIDEERSFANLHTLNFSRSPVISLSLQGPIIGCVGLIPTSTINAAGKATTDPAYMLHVENAAFGGLLNMIGNAPNRINLYNAGARYIKVLHTEGAVTTDFITGWYNYRWDAVSGNYVIEASGADALNMYPLLNPAIDYSIHDLLFQFDSGKLTNGLHSFQVKFYNATRVEIPLPAAQVQVLNLMIDNTVPVVKINSIMHNGNPVAACQIIQMTGPADGLTINFDAYDPAGNMGSWSVGAMWGDSVPAGIDAGVYNTALGDWTGVQNRIAPSSGVWVPLTSCAHAFMVTGWSRNTNGYNQIGSSSVSRFITIMK